LLDLQEWKCGCDCCYGDGDHADVGDDVVLYLIRWVPQQRRQKHDVAEEK